MKKILFILFILLIPKIVFSAPTTTLSVTPAAVDGTVITSSDENSRNSSIITWANSHDHSDIDQIGNTTSLGDGTAGNKTIEANNTDASKPFLRFDDTNNRWVVSQDGSTIATLMTVTGATSNNFKFPQSPSVDDLIKFNGSAWESIAQGSESTVLSIRDGAIQWRTSQPAVGNFTRDQATASGTQIVTGVGFKPKLVLFYAVEPNVDSEASWGLDDTGSNRFVVLDRNNSNANDWSTTSSYSIYILETSGNEYLGAISNKNDDGFTVTWTRNGTPTGTTTINYVAWP